jgi:hypothetical protein
MKKLFYFGLVGLALFEVLKVYFIMPMPGSQQMESIDIAYFLHGYRWLFRGVFGAMIIVGSIQAFKIRWWWLPLIPLLALIYIAYKFNFEMTADHMFVEPQHLAFTSKAKNILGDSSLVIAVAHNGEAKAYPIRYILYHHQVRDTLGGKPIMVTYCNVCRTGRVFEPMVNGKPEKFRLVGMDHFNAMFEDATTKSWWRQVTGEAVAGPLKGSTLPEVESIQVSTSKFFWMYPFGKVMDPDKDFKQYYDSLGRFERGKSKSKLVKRDSLSWKEKSWVVGVVVGNESKAYDWNELQDKRIINDKIGNLPIVVALSDDGQSFAAFERPSDRTIFSISNDTLRAESVAYSFVGKNVVADSLPLIRLKAYQEFWHSWRTFHPDTKH